MLTICQKPFGSNQDLGPTLLLLPHNPLYIGGGRLLPIPEKLVCRIQEGRYINMAELLPDNLEASDSIDDDQTTTTKLKQQDVTQIMDLIQCFSIFIAVVSCAKPDHVTDLIAYLILIINSQR